MLVKTQRFEIYNRTGSPIEVWTEGVGSWDRKTINQADRAFLTWDDMDMSGLLPMSVAGVKFLLDERKDKPFGFTFSNYPFQRPDVVFDTAPVDPQPFDGQRSFSEGDQYLYEFFPFKEDSSTHAVFSVTRRGDSWRRKEWLVEVTLWK